MTTATNLEELRRLSEKVTGVPSEADSIADALAEIADSYSASGGGDVKVVGGHLNIDSSKAIKGASLVMSDGTILNMPLTTIDALTLSVASGTTEETVVVTVNEALGAGNSYKYGVDISPAKPAEGENVSHLNNWDGVAEIEAIEGSDSVITIIEVDANNLAVKAGTITA